MKLAFVMPAYRAARLLPRSLPAALEAARRVEAEVLVVDPGSDDGTSALARELGARVLTLPERAGPARARNEGCEALEADVACFVDADCVLHPDVGERIRAAFLEDPELVALTGSYDEEPPERNLGSLYMNLRHHHTHQRGRREGASFWAGCGAVRLADFRAVGGFDAERFPRPMIEDIELGLRLQERGNTALDPHLQAKHLKRWSVAGVIRTDIFCRAVPWTRLLAERGEVPDDLNLRWGQRFAALLAPLALLSPAALVALPTLPRDLVPAILIAALSILALAFTLNRSLFAFFAKNGGLGLLVGGFSLHQLHLFYSALTFVVITLLTRIRRTR